MIQLGNKRYAAGPAPARLTMMLAAVLCASYAALAVTLCASLLIRERPLPEWTRNSFSLGLFGFVVVLLGISFVVMILQGSYSQTVNDPQSARATVSERNGAFASVLRAPANPVSGFFVVFFLVALAALAARFPGYLPLNVVLRLIAVAAMAVNGLAVIREARNMCRQAKIDGQIELFRGFDWDRVEVNDRSQFRKRYLSRSWKHPRDITERGEAHKFAERARSIRFRWTTVAAVAAVIMLAKFDPKAIITEIATPTAPEGAVLLALTILTGIILGPIAVQTHVGNLGELAKDYEQRAKDTDPGITITANLRPFVTAIPSSNRLDTLPEGGHVGSGDEQR